jgi:hypothetical protein
MGKGVNVIYIEVDGNGDAGKSVAESRGIQPRPKSKIVLSN